MRIAVALITLTLTAVTAASAQSVRETCCKRTGGKWLPTNAGGMQCIGLGPRTPGFALFNQCVAKGGRLQPAGKRKR